MTLTHCKYKSHLPTIPSQQRNSASSSKKRDSTESSPIGQHGGHYITAAGDTDLAMLHTMMINVSLMNGIALARWRKCVEKMIEKQKGKSKLHRLRIIQLYKADYNFCVKTIFGDWLMSFATKHCGLNKSQYGSKHGHLCQSAVLNKIIMYEILRETKQRGDCAEFDATAN